jgi:hypothetical protein
MKTSTSRIRLFLYGRVIIAAFVLACVPAAVHAADRQKPPVNVAGAPVLDANGEGINYSRESLAAIGRNAATTKRADAALGAAPQTPRPRGFVATTGGTSQQPFWQYATFGSGIGVSNIIIGPPPAGGGAREILIGGNSTNNFGGDDFWQSIRHNPATGNYDQVFVSPIYSATIKRIAVADVVGDSQKEIVVMLDDGRIYLYDFTTKNELGVINTGIAGLEGLCIADLNGDGHMELIMTTPNDLFVFNGAGNLLWQVPGAGGYDVVAGQMDNDPAMEIAATNGKVVDAATHAVQWTYNGGFGYHLKLAPFPGESYQQLIVASGWQFVYSYDIARQLPRWSINTPQDIGAIEVADVDNDGVPEVIIGDGQWGTVHVHDLITQTLKWEINNPEHGVTNIAVGDVDNDGVVDLLWGAGWTDTGPDFLYVADTTIHSIKWQSLDLEGPFLGPLIGDLDGDGQPELVICSSFSNSGYDSGRILVFDLATLAFRGISAPVVNNFAWTGVHDLKLRDLEGDGRMEIVLGADYLYDGAIEIYGFDSSNAFTLRWSNTTRPTGSPFNFVEVADLDGNGTPEIIAGNTVADSGSQGVYVYIYDYPSGVNPWRSVNLASGFNAVNGLIVQDLDGNGSKEIAALVSTGDLYTFDGPTRQLRNLRQNTGGTLLSSRPSPSGLILGDNAGVGHFLQYANNSYTETLTRQLGNTILDGINVLPDGWLWTGAGGVLNLRDLPSYDTVLWQSPATGSSVGRFVATDIRNGQTRVFSSAGHAAIGLSYTVDGAPVLASAVSRKTHGAAGPFDIALPLSGDLGIECRTGGVNGTETLVLTFNATVVSGHASVTSGIGAVQGNPTFSGNQMTIALTSVANAQRITVTVTDVAGTTGPPLPGAGVTFGVLEGDVNGSQVVNAADVAQTKTHLGQATDATNFRYDVNTNGTISATDVALVKARSGTGLP